jgi:DHA1 family 2-module integral membrane pump EmrD-like MFS transporter
MRDSTLLFSSLMLGSVGHLATDIYLPSLPHLATYFEASNTAVQLSFAVYMLSFCIIPLIIGPVSDRIGRRAPLLMGISIGMVSTILCALSTNIAMFIGSRFLQGIGLGIVVCVSRTILPENFAGKRLTQYLSYMTMLMPLVLAIGPPLGGLIQEHSSWRMVFAFLLGYLIFVRLLAKKVIFDKGPQDPLQPLEFKISGYIDIYVELFKNKQFIIFTLSSILMFMGVVAYLTVSPFLFQKLMGLTASQYGFTSLIICLSSFMSGFVNSQLIKIFKPKRLLYFASFLALSSGAMLAILNILGLTTLIYFVSALIIFFFAVPISFANAAGLALSSVKGNFGAATALMITLQYLGGSLSSFIISLARPDSIFPLALSFIIISTLYLIVLGLENITTKGASNILVNQ